MNKSIEKLFNAMLALKKCKSVDLHGDDGVLGSNGIYHFKDPTKAKLLASIEGCEDEVLNAIDMLEEICNGGEEIQKQLSF